MASQQRLPGVAEVRAVHKMGKLRVCPRRLAIEQDLAVDAASSVCVLVSLIMRYEVREGRTGFLSKRCTSRVHTLGKYVHR
jgi:hypothetical protein